MESIKLKELNDQELLQEKKKFDTNKIINASLIGLLLGVFAYSAVKSGFTFFTFFPLIFAFILFIRGQKRNEFEKELKNKFLEGVSWSKGKKKPSDFENLRRQR